MRSSSPALLDALERASRGETTFSDLAAVLRSQEQFVALAPSSALGLSSEVDGVTAADGTFVPRIFTDVTTAQAYAAERGLMNPGQDAPTLALSAAPFLFECLRKGYGGLIVNDGSAHRLHLRRAAVARLCSLLTLDDFAKLPALYVVTVNGKLFVQRPKQQQDVQAFVYDSEEAAGHGLDRIRAQAPAASTHESPTRALLEKLLAAGVSRVYVNPAVATERWYSRDELVAMLELRGGPTPLEETLHIARHEMPAEAKTVQTTVVPDSGAPIPPPLRSDEDSRAVFAPLRKKIQAHAIKVWEYIDALAFDLDLYVPVQLEPAQDFRWPRPLARDEQDRPIATVYTTKAAAEEMLAHEPAGVRRYYHLSGIEMMRWVWASPEPLNEIAIDLHPGSEGSVRFPNAWVLTAVYPQFGTIPDFEDVATIGLAELGKRPGARGLQAEVVKALTREWRQLTGVSGDTGPLLTVPFGGGHYLPAFADPDRASAFTATRPEFAEHLVPAGETPPFERWLRSAAAADGVLLDAGTAHPIPLDHTDLLVLDLWTREPDRQPTGLHIVEAVARLAAAGVLSPRQAGRVVADWPRLFLGVEHGEAGERIMTLPDADICPLFTSAGRANTFIRYYQERGLLGDEMEATPVLHQWQRSAFHQVSEHFGHGAWIDPVPEGEGGLRVDGEVLSGALERIEELLRPRVPGFAIGATTAG